MPLKIALVGNPNCGKTTFFNELTGSSQYVGNWPGVTVEKKEGKLLNSPIDAVVVDLPGIYSLSPYTPEEIVSRNYIIGEKPDLILNIIDATNLERNLYLSTQLAELGRPMIIALNMVDMLDSLGMSVNAKVLEDSLGIPVFPISASKSIGTKELMHKAIHVLHDIAHTELETLGYCDKKLEKADRVHMALHATHSDLNTKFKPYYPVVKSFYTADVTAAIEKIQYAITDPKDSGEIDMRFSAVKLFEDDPITEKQINPTGAVKKKIDEAKAMIPLTKNVDRQMIIADQRYKFICGICNKAVSRTKKATEYTLSDKIDRVVTNRFLAIPIFLAIMLGVFFITFGPIGRFLTDLVDNLINTQFADLVRNGLNSLGVAPIAVSLVCDGVINGVGAVLSFFPQIMLLFFFLSLLEDSGYMSRAAFIMDKLLGKIGLSGKSFVPMLMGFGCSVPAVMATRTLENEKDKRLTILLTPFMSCSAKMPVYLLFITAFFSKSGPLVIFSIYVTGIIVAILLALIYKSTILKGDRSAFVLELPQYRMPTLKSLWLHIWERAKDFLTRAGTILLGASIVIWFLQTFSFSMQVVSDGNGSMLESIGKAISPVLAPLGFGFWQASVALFTGLIAKESVITTFSVLLGSTGIAGIFPSSLSAFAFMIFVLLYTPCVATVSAIIREMRSAKWTLFAIISQLGVAYIVTFLVYNVGRILGLG